MTASVDMVLPPRKVLFILRSGHTRWSRCLYHKHVKGETGVCYCDTEPMNVDRISCPQLTKLLGEMKLNGTMTSYTGKPINSAGRPASSGVLGVRVNEGGGENWCLIHACSSTMVYSERWDLLTPLGGGIHVYTDRNHKSDQW